MPIYYDVPQRSEAWEHLKQGKPSTSLFKNIVTPGGKTAKLSSWERYADHLIAERLLNQRLETYTSPWMARGQHLEPDAVAWYELEHDIETQPMGFITTDDGRIGYSPDRLVGEDGLLEIKIPGHATHVRYLRTGKFDEEYRPQTQGALYVSQRSWIDIVSWHPVLPPFEVRVERDETYIALIEKEVVHFTDELDRVTNMILSVGEKPVPKDELREMLRQSLEVS